MARQELESITFAVFHNELELRVAVTSYYEGILKMPGASGVLNKASYKRPIEPMADCDIDVQAPPPANEAAAAPDAAAAAADPPAATAAAADPPAEAASAASSSPVREKPAKGGRGSKSK